MLGAAVEQRDCLEHLNTSQQGLVLETCAVVLEKQSCLVLVALSSLLVLLLSGAQSTGVENWSCC